MTCRGSRFNPTITEVGTASNEWVYQNLKSSRNFIRKWGHFVKHDEMMKPIIPPKYDIGFIVHDCSKQILHALEPWCSDIYITMPNPTDANSYISEEQKNTKFDLLKRIHPISEKPYNNILVEFDASKLTEDNFNQIIANLSEIITESNEVGEFELDSLKITINSLETYEKELINLNENKPYMEVA